MSQMPPQRAGASTSFDDDAGRLVDSQLLLRIAARMAKVGGWILDVPSNTVTWSDEMFDLIESPRGRVPGWREVLRLFPPDDRRRLVAALQVCVAEGSAIDLELEVDTVAGRRRWVRLAAEARHGADGRVRRVIGAFQDISDARAAQDERREMTEQALRAQRVDTIGALASGVAHDLNNVLTPIVLSVHMLLQDEDNAVRKQLLGTIARSAERGAEMVKQVLGFASGVEGGRRPVDVGRLLREVHRILADTFPKGIDVRVDAGDHLPPVIAQPTQLHQVMVNLAVNARDAMPDGGRLVLRTATVVSPDATDEDSSHLVVIEVQDTGVGMPPEVLARIFEPFFTTKEAEKGTGLGLSTSASIVAAHGGTLEVDSRPGRGSTFRITLPAAPGSVAGGEETRHATPRRGHGELVLVADDEAAVRDLTRRTLEVNGYEVVEAADGAQAVALFAQHRDRVAAVLMDTGMPVMDGLTTIPVLRAMRPDVPIVLASGIGGGGAEDAMAQAYLAKPYGSRQLLQAVDTVMSPMGAALSSR